MQHSSNLFNPETVHSLIQQKLIGSLKRVPRRLCGKCLCRDFHIIWRMTWEGPQDPNPKIKVLRLMEGGRGEKRWSKERGPALEPGHSRQARNGKSRSQFWFSGRKNLTLRATVRATVRATLGLPETERAASKSVSSQLWKVSRMGLSNMWQASAEKTCMSFKRLVLWAF